MNTNILLRNPYKIVQWNLYCVCFVTLLADKFMKHLNCEVTFSRILPLTCNIKRVWRNTVMKFAMIEYTTSNSCSRQTSTRKFRENVHALFKTPWLKGKSGYQTGAYPGFCSMKRLEAFLLPLDVMLVHRRVTPSIKFAGTHLYTCLERRTVRLKRLAQEHNTMCPARTRTQTTRSGVGAH